TVTLRLTINNGINTDTLVTACKQFALDRPGGNYTASQEGVYPFTNANGCEDTVTLRLTINNGINTDTLVTACKQFTWDRTGVTYTTSQDVVYPFTNAKGCENTVTFCLNPHT